MTVYTANVDATGATDVTSALRAFFATVPDGTAATPNTVRFQADAMYRVDGTLELSNRNHLIIDGNGATCTASTIGARDRSHTRFNRCNDIRITDLTIVGSNPNAGIGASAFNSAYEAQHAFDIAGGSDITIDHCTVSLIWGDHVYLGTYGVAEWVDGVLIEHNDFINNGRQAFSFIGCRNVEIRYNNTTEVRYAVLDFEPNEITQGSDNVWVHHNTFGESRLTFCSSKGNVSVVDNVTIEDNTAVRINTIIDPPSYNLRRNWTIRRNVASGVMGNGNGNAMPIERVENLVLVDNVQPMEPGRDMYLAKLTDCINPTVGGNLTPNGLGEAVYVTTYFPGTDPSTSDVRRYAKYTAPTVIGTSTVHGEANTAVSLTFPTGSRVGDLAVLCLAHRWTTNAAIPNGWSEIGSYASASGPQAMMMLAKRVAAGDLGSTISCPFVTAPSNSDNTRAGILTVLRGVDSYALSTAQSMGNVTNIDLPTVTTTVPATRVLYFAMHARGDIAYWPGESDHQMIGQVETDRFLGLGTVLSTFTIRGTGTGRARILSAPFQSSCAVIAALLAPPVPAVVVPDALFGVSFSAELAERTSPPSLEVRVFQIST